jgi:hypothetical protein
MHVDMGPLRAVLAASGRGAPERLDALDRLRRQAAAGAFMPASLRDLDAAALLAALRAAGAGPAVALRAVSLSAHAAPSVDHAGTAFWTSLLGGVSRDLAAAMAARFRERIEARLGLAGVKAVQDAVWASLGEPLWHAFEGNRWDGTGHAFLLAVRGGILAAIGAYACLLAAGDPSARQLEPLLASAASAVPVGELAERSGSWLVVVA